MTRGYRTRVVGNVITFTGGGPVGQPCPDVGICGGPTVTPLSPKVAR